MSIKVLVVDDEVNFAEMLVKRLRSRNFDALAASDGPSALATMHSLEPDVVILDVRMPGMDGHEMLGRIRTAHPAVKVIMLTAHGSIDDAVTDLRRGAFNYLQKPCSITDLIEAVQQAAQPTEESR